MRPLGRFLIERAYLEGYLFIYALMEIFMKYDPEADLRKIVSPEEWERMIEEIMLRKAAQITQRRAATASSTPPTPPKAEPTAEHWSDAMLRELIDEDGGGK